MKIPTTHAELDRAAEQNVAEFRQIKRKLEVAEVAHDYMGDSLRLMWTRLLLRITEWVISRNERSLRR